MTNELRYIGFNEKLYGVPLYEYIANGKVFEDKEGRLYVEAIFFNEKKMIPYDEALEYIDIMKNMELEGRIFYIKR